MLKKIFCHCHPPATSVGLNVPINKVCLKLMVTIFLSLQYEKDGYLVIEDVFDTDKLRKLSEAANEFVRR